MMVPQHFYLVRIQHHLLRKYSVFWPKSVPKPTDAGVLSRVNSTATCSSPGSLGNSAVAARCWCREEQCNNKWLYISAQCMWEGPLRSNAVAARCWRREERCNNRHTYAFAYCSIQGPRGNSVVALRCWCRAKHCKRRQRDAFAF